MDEFLDLYPLPTNLKEVECQSVGRKFHFLRSLNPATIKSEVSDSLNYANSFGNFQTLVFSSLDSLTIGLITESSTVGIPLGFVDFL